MTGYGRAQGSRGEVSAEVELRSVNSRHLAVKCRMPGDLVRLEQRIEATLKRTLSRGSVDVFVRVQTGRRRQRPTIDEATLKMYRRTLDDLGGGDAATLLTLPGVVILSDDGPAPSTLDRLIMSALKEALEGLTEARASEGVRLQRAMDRECARLAKVLAAIRRRVPALVAEFRRNLDNRLSVLLDGQRMEQNDPVLRREVAVLADRTDVTEELDRLESHLEALAQAMDARGPAGRRLDFLLQEIGREVNTVGSKCTDLKVLKHVIDGKSAVERLREQAANIE